MTFPDTPEQLTALLRERIVFDIGQISKPMKRWLDRQVRKGAVQSTIIYNHFPRPKRGYWIVKE
jgi:hypothetical protein